MALILTKLLQRCAEDEKIEEKKEIGLLSRIMINDKCCTALQLHLFPIDSTCQLDMSAKKAKPKIKVVVLEAPSITSCSQNKSPQKSKIKQPITKLPSKEMSLRDTRFV